MLEHNDELEPYECPMCGCPDRILLGQLGTVVHTRCRDCGLQYATDLETFSETQVPKEALEVREDQ